MKPKKPLHVYLIDENGDSYYYVAASPGRALTMFLKDNTYPKLTAARYKAECPETTITECDSTKEFTITDRASDTGADQDEHVTMTFAKWIKERGEGCLATSDF